MQHASFDLSSPIVSRPSRGDARRATQRLRIAMQRLAIGAGPGGAGCSPRQKTARPRMNVLLKAIVSFFVKRDKPPFDEAYLAQATDLCDLERRMRLLDERRAYDTQPLTFVPRWPFS